MKVRSKWSFQFLFFQTCMWQTRRWFRQTTNKHILRPVNIAWCFACKSTRSRVLLSQRQIEIEHEPHFPNNKPRKAEPAYRKLPLKPPHPPPPPPPLTATTTTTTYRRHTVNFHLNPQTNPPPPPTNTTTTTSSCRPIYTQKKVRTSTNLPAILKIAGLQCYNHRAVIIVGWNEVPSQP